MFLTMHMGLQDRKARDAAFALALEELRPECALMRSMVEARVRAGLTQAQLAQRMGTKQPVIARMEAGRRSPNVKTLRKLAAATGSRLVVRLDQVEPLEDAL
jgi:ribosome-binding protein aMBF1 (putative translation factor)